MKVKLLKKFRKLIDYDTNAFNKFGEDLAPEGHFRKFDKSYVSSVQLALNYDVEKFTGLKMSMVFMAHPISVEDIRKFFKKYESYRRKYWLSSEVLKRSIKSGNVA